MDMPLAVPPEFNSLEKNLDKDWSNSYDPVTRDVSDRGVGNSETHRGLVLTSRLPPQLRLSAQSQLPSAGLPCWPLKGGVSMASLVCSACSCSLVARFLPEPFREEPSEEWHPAGCFVVQIAEEQWLRTESKSLIFITGMSFPCNSDVSEVCSSFKCMFRWFLTYSLS